jgi:hypothetical protein
MRDPGGDFMSRKPLKINIFTIALAILLALIAIKASAQVIEVTEAKEDEAAQGKDEKPSELCLSAVKSYEEVKKRIDERIAYLESVAVIGDLLELKDEMNGEAALPEKCSEEVGFAIDALIVKTLGEKTENVDLERMRIAAKEMEAELMPEYLELSGIFEDVCEFCGKKPRALADDPLSCRALAGRYPLDSKKRSSRDCSDSMLRYDNAREALMYRRDLCRQSAKIEGMDNILFWFQGRDDLPLVCAVQIKEFMDSVRKRAEGSSDASRYAFAVAQEKCGAALFPIFMRYGMSVRDVCESCKKAESKLRKDGMSCY